MIVTGILWAIMIKYVVKTNQKREIIDITDIIQKKITNLSKKKGILSIFVAHTTAAITTFELDLGTDEDFLVFMDEVTPHIQYRHEHNPAHAPDHIWAGIIGTSITVPFMKDQLLLGTWQRIVLVELDGPRERNIFLTVN